MMKRFITIFAAVTAAFSTFAMTSDDGHKLTALWEKYEAANKADKPKTEAEILSQIKAQAKENRYSVDFYDAATKYVDAVARRNWKDREPARKALKQEIEEFNEPIVTFIWMDQNCYESAETLKEFAKGKTFNGRNEPFYRGVGSFLAGVLPHFIENDAEYVLWRLVAKGDKESIETLQKQIGTRYPAQPALEFWQACNLAETDGRRKAIEGLAAKFEGTAAGLLPKSEVLRYKFQDIQESKPSNDAPYKDFYKECKAFEKQRSAFKGEERIIADKVNTVWNLINNLEEKSLGISFDKGKLIVLFRNMATAKVNLYQSDAKKALKTWDAKNPVNSFYKLDTLKIDLPKLGDGDYLAEVVNGKVVSSNSYEQYTLSIANRKDSKGLNVFVADHISGKPLTKATIYLKKGSSVVASASISLNGFTPLPASITKHINNKSNYTLYAESGSRKSRTVWLQGGSEVYGDSSKDIRCNIYRDRGAYNPGDELKFKAILYSGEPMVQYQALEGRKVTVILNDSEGNEISKLGGLKTNAYGSVSGTFTLPKGLRNGWFSLQIKDGKNYIGGDSFRVDEFVLPTFEIALDKRETLFLEGDDVPVEGSVTSYSGHKLSGARAILIVQKYSDKVFEAEQEIGTDNRFSFIVPKVQAGYHNLTVKVVDATGETMEKGGWFYIGSSLSVEMKVENEASGEFTLRDERTGGGRLWRPRAQRAIVTEDDIVLKFQARDGNGNSVPLPVHYELTGVCKGTTASGESVSLKGVPAGVYTLKTSVEERDAKGSAEMKILVLRPQDKDIPADVQAVFLPGSETVDGSISARFGSGDGTAYAQVALFGDRKEVLLTKSVTAKGMADLKLDYRKAYPDAVRLQVFWFIDGKAWTYDRQYRRAKTRLDLPLKFTCFTSDAYPGTEYTFTLKTAAGVEALAAVWDKSIDAVARNWWPSVTLSDYSVPSVSVNSACGRVAGGGIAMDDDAVFDEVQVVGYGATRFSLRSKSASVNAMVMEDAAVPMAVESARAEEAGGASEEDDVAIRSEFASSLCFQPHLVSAADGTLSFSFRTSDKLSTYYVRVYAHNAAMQNAMEEKEMVVSLPVKVALQEPRYLYEGDTYIAAVTVSSIASAPVSGVVKLAVPGGLIQSSGPVTIPAGETVTYRFPVEVPSVIPGSSSVIPGSDRESLTLTASFVAPDFSGAVRVTIPVYPARQTLTEAHSAVLLAGMSREALLSDLRGRFVNVSSGQAVLKEITVLDMVREAIPSHVEPSGKDVLSLSEAWYTQCIAAQLQEIAGQAGNDAAVMPDNDAAVMPDSDRASHEDLLKQILACRNSDGGFAWFEGMHSSPVITAVLLERFALLKARGVEVPEASASVKYLDKVMFGTQKPLWYGWLSDAQYMHVRALYAAVPFEVQAVTKADKQRLSDFKKYAKSYLTPSRADGRGLQGAILAKARRLLTLRALAGSPEGVSLAKAWGIGLTSKLRKSISADVASLLEYAVEHRDGGWYYPNAVLPWRGLLESEAYAHALLCRLLSDSASLGLTRESPAAIADGIRLWLMLQKETQKWDAEPSFVDAIDAILSGSAEVLDTKVLALSATYEAPFDAIKAAGNGFTVERKFFLNGAEVAPGAELSVGDKITVKYKIWNAENRSFVKLDAGREAALQPVRQLSGLSGWTLYRNVKAERTEYFWEVCPEEDIVLEEEFYVTRAGRFRAPVLVIESLYAPHYRANSAYLTPLEVK